MNAYKVPAYAGRMKLVLTPLEALLATALEDTNQITTLLEVVKVRLFRQYDTISKTWSNEFGDFPSLFCDRYR